MFLLLAPMNLQQVTVPQWPFQTNKQTNKKVYPKKASFFTEYERNHASVKHMGFQVKDVFKLVIKYLGLSNVVTLQPKEG